MQSLNSLLIEKHVRAALEEDLGHGQDITSNLLIPAGEMASAQINARQDGVLCGLIVALSAFSLCDAELDMTIHAQDGDEIKAGQTIAEITGPARSLLMAERVALNFLSHMSGIATMTRAYIDAVSGTGTEICDTRKTLPGLRALQKYAVITGGGSNHRYGLDDAILIKDNHIAVAGGITQALEQVALLNGHMQKVEIEVDTLEQLQEVLENDNADVVMLDNMDADMLKKAVEMAKEHDITTEASGGVTLETVADLAASGVDYISIGALTHSVKAFDFGLDIK